MKRRLATLLVSIVLSSAAWAAASSRPNIVLILADDMGYSDASVYGCTDFSTPNIDAIARGGIRCTQGYVTAPVCSPSRAAILTGRYQQRFGHELNLGDGRAKDPGLGLPPSETTFASRLQASGYKTGLIGKWHLGGHAHHHPNVRGFDEFFGFLMGQHGYFPGPRGPRESPIERNGAVVEEKEYLTDAFGREAVAFLDRHHRSPFFLYLAFNAPHVPLHATARDLARVPQLEERRRTYAAMMLAMDDAIGRVLAKLRELELEQNTLVFFLSDNGGPPGNGSRNDPFRGYKGEMFEGGVRVPFVVRWPARLPAGRTYDQPVSALDVSATALAAAGIAPDPAWKLDGKDLVPFLSGRMPGRPHEVLYWRFGHAMALRRGSDKLLRTSNQGPALFDLGLDAGERNDRAAASPDKVESLDAEWKRWSGGLIKHRWGDPDRAGVGAREP